MLLALMLVLASQLNINDYANVDDYIDASLKQCYATKTRKACTIELPAGSYEFKRTIQLCPGVRLIGQGHGQTGTKLFVKSPITGIKARSYSECKALGLLWDGATYVEDLYLVDASVQAQTSTLAGITSGIFVQNPARITRVRTQGFVIGIQISADVSRTPPSNANRWRVDDVSVGRAHHAGVLIRGGDTNVGTFLSGYVGGNCFSATLWTPAVGFDCAGLVERSFLGNTFVGVSTAANAEHKPGCYTDSSTCVVKKFPGFAFVGLSQHSVCLGCYTESDQALSQLSQWSMALGGLSSWDRRTNGLRLDGGVANTLTVRNPKDPEGKISVVMGNAMNMQDGIIGFDTSASKPLRLKYDVARKTIIADVANLGVARPFTIRLVNDDLLGPAGLVIVPQKLFLVK
jgi:hypothetical protein